MSSRVPNVPGDVYRPVVTIEQHIRAGMELTSFCSTGEHRHILNLEALASRYDAGRAIDYQFKVEQICPECGAPGGGLSVRLVAE
jgi:hypothetical protein